MMARVESIRFAFKSLELYHDHSSPSTASQAHAHDVGFHLQIRESVEHGDCRLKEVFEYKVILPKPVFGGKQHRNYVARILRQAGWPHSRGRPSLEVILDAVFCQANSLILEDYRINEPEYSSSNLSPRSSVPTILLCFKKYVRYQEEEEEVVDHDDQLEALELSTCATSFQDSSRRQGIHPASQQVFKTVPATKIKIA